MLVTSYDNFVGAGEVASWAKGARNLPVETSKGEIDSMKIINLGSRINNNYIIKLNKGYLLIDTEHPKQFGRFKKKLRKHNIHIKDISYILLTHAHGDHAVFLNELLNNSDAKVILHPRAVDRLREGVNSIDGGSTSFLDLAFYKILK